MSQLLSRPALIAAAVTSFIILALDFVLDFATPSRLQAMELHLVLVFVTVLVLYLVFGKQFKARELAEAEKQASEQRLANVLYTAPDAIIVVDRQLSITVFNQGAEQIFGYAADEAIKRPINLLLPLRLAPKNIQYLRGLIEENYVGPLKNHMEVIARHKSGAEFPTEVNISTLTQGQDVSITLIFRDITIRKQAEEALLWVHEDLEQRITARTASLQQANLALRVEISERKRVEAERERLLAQVEHERERAKSLAADARHQADELDAVFVAMTDAVMVFDTNGVIQKANPSAVNGLGFELTGMTNTDLARRLHLRHPDGVVVPATALPVWRVFEGKVVHGERYVINTTSGEEKIVLISSAPIAANGAVSGSVTVVHDITQHEHLQENLRKALAQTRERQFEIAGLLTGARAVLEHQNFESAAGALISICSNLIGSTAGFISLVDEDETTKIVVIEPKTSGRFEALLELPLINDLTQQAYQLGRSIFENRVHFDHPNQTPAEESILLTPLVVREISVGVLGLIGKPQGFSKDDGRMANAFGELAAIALYNSRTLQSLENSETRFRSVVQAANEAIVTIDRTGKIVFWNRAATDIFGYSSFEAVGQYVSLLMPDNLKHAHHGVFEQSLTEKRPELVRTTMELTGLRKNGDEFPMQLSISGWNIQNEPFFTGIIQDITVRKQAERALENARTELETHVIERTQELAMTNKELVAEIEERTIAERRLSLRTTALESAANGIIITNRIGKILWANPAYCEMTGYPADQVQGHTPDIFSSDSDDLWDTLLAGKVWHGEVVSRHRDGTFYTQEQTITPVLDESSRISHFIAIIQDVTERKQFQLQLERNNRELLALSQSERNQRQFAEALVHAAISLNTSLHLDEVLDQILEQTQRVVPCDAADISLFEENSVTLARHRGLESMPKNDLVAGQRYPVSSFPMLDQMLNTAAPLVVANTQQTAEWRSSNSFNWVKSYAAAPLQVENQIIGFLNLYSITPGFFAPDIIDRLNAFAAHAVVAIQNARLYQNLERLLEQEQSMRDQLVQNEKFVAMGRMLASVAHELNNPLQTIMNCMFLSKQCLTAEAPIQEYLDISTTEIQRLSNLVAQLRELYRPGDAETMQKVSLKYLLREIRLLVTPHLQQHRVQWVEMPIDADIVIAGIPDKLKQVFLNISLNAIEAMHATGGRLTVDVLPGAEPGQIAVVFKDNGPGIPAEDLPRLFEPFFTTKSSGTGLGLSISYDIVRNHRGQLAVDSRLGEGTSFTVFLPSTTIGG